MAQIIRHRRGSLESLSAATSSFQKGELIITSGSSNITASNGASIVFAATESGSIQAVNRFLIGNNAPNVFPSAQYNGLLKGVPYYASGSSTLYLLGSGGNDAINLVGNIQPFSSSVSASLAALSSSIGGGNIGNSVNLLNSFTGSYATTGSNTFTGQQNLGSNSITFDGGNVETTAGGIQLYSNDFAQLNYDGTSYVWVDGDGVNFEASGNTALFDNDGNLVLPAFTLPNITGGANQVLSNDGTGTLTWTDLVDSASVATSFSQSAYDINSLSSSVASVTGNFSSSVATSFSASAASVASLSSSISTSQNIQDGRLSSLENFSSSAKIELANLELTSASVNTSISNLNLSSASQQLSIDSLNSFSSSADSKFSEIGTVSGSLISSASAASVSISNLNSFTQSFSQSVATDFSASAASVAALSASVASVTGDFSSSVATSFSASTASQTQLSSSVATSLSASAAEISASQHSQDVRIDSLSNLTGSYATTGSNVFYGTQVITGSLYVAYDVIVQGSSSLQYITASQVDLGTNRIVLNNDSPAVRFGGISVQDSGSAQGASGSLLWDSLNNNWIYQHPNVGPEAGMTAMLISGPKNSGSMGDEAHITPGKIMVAVGDDHIGDSIITQKTDNSAVVVSGSIGISGSITLTDNASTFKILGNGFGETYLQSTANNLVLQPVYGDVLVKGTNLKVDGTISGSIEGIGNVNAYSTSVDSRFSASVAATTALSASVASVTGDFSSSVATSFSASAASQTALSGAISTSIANLSSSLDTLSSSFDTRITNNSSSIYNLSGSNYSASSSFDTRISNVSSSIYDLSGSAYSVSSSFDTRITNNSSSIYNLSGSVYDLSGSVHDLSGSAYSVSSSFDTRISNVSSSVHDLNSKTGSYATTGSNTFYGTQTVSGSVNVSGSANFNGAVAVNDSNMNLTNSSSLNLTSGSSLYVNGDGVISGSIVGIGNVTAFSSSVDSRISAISASLGGGGSIGTRVAGLEALTGSYATTGSNQFNGNQSISGSVNVGSYVEATTLRGTGSLFLQPDSNNSTYLEIYNTAPTDIHILASTGVTYVGDDTTYVKVDTNSDVVTITGIGNVNDYSTSVDSRFSSSAYDLNQLSASVANVTGNFSSSVATSFSASAASQIALSSSISASQALQNGRLTSLENFSSSAKIELANLELTSASVNTSVSALNSSSASQQISIDALNNLSASQIVSIDALNSFSASAKTELYNLELNSASVNTSIVALNSFTSSNSNINSFTQSTNVRLDNLELNSASVNTSIYNINGYTASSDTRLDNLELNSGSLNTSVYNINGTTASLNTSVAELNTFSSSAKISIFNINGTTASLNTSVTELNTFSASAKTSITELNSYTSSLKSAIELTGSSVTILGDLTVKGTTTSVESTTVQLGDNIIELNGTGAANGGLLVKDPTAPNTASGSLLWDSTNDYWKAGTKDNESKILVAGGDSVVSGSSQITLSSTTGYSDFSSSIATSFSSSAASVTSLSASVASVTGDFSSSVATSFSQSAYNLNQLSASVANVTGNFSSSVATSFSASTANVTSLSSSLSASQAVQDGRLSLLEISTGSLNSFTSSIDTTIKTKLNVEGVVSGSSQIDITQTTGYSTFSSSIETRISIIDGGTY
jgi:hypothetical protein